MTLQWDSRYALGHERIDAEHQIFLNLIVQFNDLSQQGASMDKLLRTLREIIKYAEFHFVSEENVMLDCSYPDYPHHTDLHQRLLAKVQDEMFRLKSGQAQPTEVFDFLFEWFALHTTQEDRKLVEFLGKES